MCLETAAALVGTSVSMLISRQALNSRKTPTYSIT